MEDLRKSIGYSSIRDDPINQLKLIDKYVKVELIKSCSFEGFVHCFDPVTNSIILSVLQDGGFRRIVIPGHGILDIAELETPSDVLPPNRISHNSTPKDTSRKSEVMDWLKSNLLPVSDVNDRIVFGNVSILPPYSVMDICTDNPMVAMQIKKLIENMPEALNMVI